MGAFLKLKFLVFNHLTIFHVIAAGAATVDVCAQPVRAGPCTDAITRWAYDPTTDSCSQFTYSGCGGNGNSFATFVECLGNCIGK